MEKINEIENYINLQIQTFKNFPSKSVLEEHSKNKMRFFDLLNEGFFSHKGENFKIKSSHLFAIDGTQFLVYETNKAFFVYGSLYNILWGIFHKDGSFEQIHNEDNILGYKIDNVKLQQELKKISKTKPQEFNLEKQKKVLLFGFILNIGHHVWNEQSGLEYLLDVDLLEKFDEVWIGNYDYFNFSKFFKEKGLKVIQVNHPEKLEISTNNILFLATELVVFSKTINRLQEWISSNSSIEKAKLSSPIICIQLRQNIRKWVSEINGVANIISEFKKIYPSSNFIIDGFARSYSCPQTEKINIETDMQAYEQILNLLNDRTNIECSIGKDINDKMNIIKQADLVLSPIGSGGILTNWVLNKAIITYGPTSYYNWTKQHSETHLECYNNQIYYIPKERIIMQENQSDYDFNWKVLFDMCRDEIDKRKFKECTQ